MGTFLSSISQDGTTLRNSSLMWTEPLQKVKQFHGIFKSVCDTFAIRKEQFSQIFGTERNFWALDRQKAGVVNALEVFCGLIFYASAGSWKQKLKFLFFLFDFNEIKSISIVDLQYMVLCVCNYTYKALEKNAKANETEVAEWLTRRLDPKTRINITKLNHFLLSSVEMQTFLRMTGISGVQYKETILKEEMKKQPSSLVQSKEIQAKLKWLEELSQKVTKCKKSKELENYSCKADWVYGIHLASVHHPIVAFEDYLLYSVGGLLVVYCPSANQQRIYTGHRRTITAFCVSQRRIVASSEGSSRAEIHLWCIDSLTIIAIFHILHDCRVHLLHFLSNQLLATAGDAPHCPILIYNVHTTQVQYSFSLGSAILEIVRISNPLYTIPQQYQSIMVCFSQDKLFVIDYELKQITTYQQGNILCGAALIINYENPYLRVYFPQETALYVVTGHSDGSLRAVCYYSQTKSIKPWDDILRVQNAIQCMYVNEEVILIVAGSQIKIYPLFCIRAMEEGDGRCVDLNKMNDKCISRQIKYLAVSPQLMVVCTEAGDCINIRHRCLEFKGRSNEEGDCYAQEQLMERMNTLVMFEGHMGPMCLFQSNTSQILLVVSNGCIVNQIDPLTHQVESVWNLGREQVITVIEAAESDEKVCFIICGCKSGKLLIRLDWEESPRMYDCAAEILAAKVSKDTSYLLVATSNNYLLFFTQVNKVFSSLRKLHFQNQFPLSINFLDNYTFFLINTSANNVYLIEIPSLKHQNLDKRTDPITLSTLRLVLPQTNQNVSHAILGGDMKYYLITLSNGQFIFFENMAELSNHSYKLIHIHQSPITNLVLADNQESIFTLAKSDFMFLQWSVFLQTVKNSFMLDKTFPYSHADTAFTLMKSLTLVGKEDNHHKQVEYLFRGTKLDKLNECLGKQMPSADPRQLSLSKRRDNLILHTAQIYGVNYNHINMVKYYKEQQFVYISGRFLIFESVTNGSQRIMEVTNARLSDFKLTGEKEIVVAEGDSQAKIIMSNGRSFATTHINGILHIEVCGDKVLSYGVAKIGYSINLHNLHTGRLLLERSTHQKISQFLMLEEDQFISIYEIRRWKNFSPSVRLGTATAGAVLPNRKDVCLGGSCGDLYILSELGIFLIVQTAHQGVINLIHIREAEGSFQAVTAGEDEHIKTWNNTFQLIVAVDLRKNNFHPCNYLNSKGCQYPQMVQSRLLVTTLDSKGDKLLVGLHHGQVFEVSICLTENKEISKEISQSIDTMKEESIENSNQSTCFGYEIQMRKVLEGHCSHNPNAPQRYTVFDVHNELPILVSSANDGTVIFRDFVEDTVLTTYRCGGDQRVKAVRFSPGGRMLVLGFNCNIVMTFLMNLTQNKTIELTHLQTFKGKPQQHEVQTIKFSSCSTYFAVSYLPAAEATASTNIYKIKNQKNHFSEEAFYILKQTLFLKEDDKKFQKHVRCIWNLHFIADQSKIYLLSMEQYIGKCNSPIIDGKRKYTLYCVTDGIAVENEFAVDWSSADFAPLLNAKLTTVDKKTEEKQYSLSTMLVWRDHLILGSRSGKLHIVKKHAFITYESSQMHSNMCMSRTYCALTSPITQIEVSSCGKYLFVSSACDQSIVKYYLKEEDKEADCDYSLYNFDIKDPQFLSRKNFHQIINNARPLREQITEMLQDVQEEGSPKVVLSACKVFGRRAQDRRNNIAYFDQNIVYILGPNIIIQSRLNEKEQTILPADPSQLSHRPQISVFDFRQDILLAATEQQSSTLFVWQLRSRSCITRMRVHCAVVQGVKLCKDKRAILYGVNEYFELVVEVVDWWGGVLIGYSTFEDSGNWKIKDICEVESVGIAFVTCGFEHLAQWGMRGDELVHYSFDGIPAKRTYMVVRALGTYVVTGCELGNLYLWKNTCLLHVLETVHVAAIFALAVGSSFIVSGGRDGVIQVTTIQNGLLVPKWVRSSKVLYEEYQEEQKYPLRLQIQSITLLEQTILYGTRSGDIFQRSISEQSKKVEQRVYSLQEEEIVSVAFSRWQVDLFYTLTKSGYIQVWSLKSYSQVLSHHLRKCCKKIYACEKLILVGCKSEIIALEVGLKNSLRPVSGMCVRSLSNEEDERGSCQITAFCLSDNEVSLAVAVSASASSSFINIYKMGSTEIVYQLSNLKHEIEYLDFDVENKYVLFKDGHQEIGLINLENYKRINTIFVEMKAEWQHEGLRISPEGQQIYYSYNCQNKITTLCRLKKNKIIVGDEMGTVRIFNYPSPADRLGELHIQCYTLHMNHINNIVVHPVLPFVITTALYDKSLLLSAIHQ